MNIQDEIAALEAEIAAANARIAKANAEAEASKRKVSVRILGHYEFGTLKNS